MLEQNQVLNMRVDNVNKTWKNLSNNLSNKGVESHLWASHLAGGVCLCLSLIDSSSVSPFELRLTS